ncbi:MAG: PD-(D/E)XK nuclease family protein, partial [Betaproteobacteria bacterium]|nr:PD-(D/E)XK nuclease family protein [Betaproteobacteria bacterium]
SEATQRARLDAGLRKRAPARLTLPKLLGLIGAAGAGCPLLARRLAALFAHAKQNLAGSRSPQDWARQSSALLEAAGFPGERALDSCEFQARAKLHEVLGEFARLARVSTKITYNQSLIRLRRLCTDTLFQPESGAAPIQVLGIFEAAGLGFDHLWVSGLSDEAWPLAVRPNPLIPLALQKKAGIPQAAADSSLARDRRITAGWLVAAGEVLVSHPLREKDRDLLISPLIAAVPAGTWGALNVADYPRYRDLIHRARSLESVADGAAPVPAATTVRGGARVLADQAACPFRAFARHRLGAQPMAAPAPGLNAADRGTLIHALLKSIWDELKNSATLGSIEPAKLDEIIGNAAAAAIAEVGKKRPGVLEGRFAQLERERLAGLAREWLEAEKQRPDFEVIVREDPREFKAAGLSLKGRIDRMDRLADGSHALVDYKTGKASVSAWLGERPDDPQLPLYAINAQENIAAVVFAKVK